MEIVKIQSFKALTDKLNENKKGWLLLYKTGNEPSQCALANLSAVETDLKDILMMTVDVAEVRDIHEQYEIKTVPTLVQFEETRVKNIFKGCHATEYFKNLIEESAFFSTVSGETEKPIQRVTVYTTPTCSWCTTIKTHLRKYNIRFSEVDVSKDQAAAQAMVSKSGQQGVPQTEINGEMIVGFDKNRINKLLNIQG
jgi:glutaredoxin-like YruB-family protein